MKLFVLLIGMVCIIEGLPYAASPEAMKKWLITLSETDPKTLRVMGIVIMGIGFAICFVVQKTALFS